MKRIRRGLSFILRNGILIAIIVVASLLRLSGASPGYPPYHSDEGISYSAAVSMIKNNNLDPLRYDYPAVVPLVNFVAYRAIFIPLSWAQFYVVNITKVIDGFMKLPLSTEDYKRVFQLEILGNREYNALAWGRITTALFGIGVVVLTYALAKRLFGRKTAILAALFTAINYRLVLNSHLGLPDTYNSFFLLASSIATWNLFKKQTSRNYIIAGLLAGVSLATKYQPFAIISLFIVHILIAYKEKTLKQKVKSFFRPEAFVLLLLIVCTFIAINPYAFIKIEETIDWLTYVSSKYRPGRYEIDVFSLSYLYHLAIGPVLVVLSAVGLIVGIIKERMKTVFLLSIICPFLYITIYYSGAGFYTRNFVTIIPFLFILAAVGFNIVSYLYKTHLVWLVTLACALFVSQYQFGLSQIVASEYTRPWNFNVLSTWLNKNVDKYKSVSAHSSVPLPSGVNRLSYDYHLDFTMSEFRNSGADLAIANLDWATNDFYWWMTQSFKDGLKYWNKPVGIMEETYTAMAIRELSDYSIYQVLNHWAAPDSDFIVSKVPTLSSKKGVLDRRFTFEDLNGWHKNGTLETEGNNLIFENGQLGIVMASAKSPILRWESEPISVEQWNGVIVEARMKTKNSKMHEGFLFAKYFSSELDALNNNNRLAVRLSARNENNDKWNLSELISKVPSGASYMTIGFQVYDASLGDVYLDDVNVYRATVEESLNGWTLKSIYIDPDLLFPSSHGYL